jgi:phosphatidylserine/phosphatidylglycerophosphate/cardiolipin synthase-like enzyme
MNKTLTLFLTIYFLLASSNTWGQSIDLLLNSPSNVVAPTDNCEQEICRSLLKLINSATKTIDFAIYGIRKQSAILNALVDAQNRGVIVRGVVDSDINGENYYTDTPLLLEKIHHTTTDHRVDLETLKKKEKNDFNLESWCPKPEGFDGPVQCIGYPMSGNKCLMASHASREELVFNGDIMHNKFFVIDHKYVWTGSSNVSDSGTGGYNANAVLLINDTDVASWYTREFEQMHEKGKFHRNKDQNGRRDKLTKTIAGAAIEVKFSPQGYAMVDKLDQWLIDSNSSIDIAVFFLTHKRLTHHLIAAHQRGVKVRVIIDATAATNGYTKHEILRAAGIPVKVENWGGKMHMKSAVIDGQRLVIGSMNWTTAGERDNDENTFFIESISMSREYENFFQQMWDSIPKKWLQGNPDPESLNSGTSCTDLVDNDFDNLADQADSGCGSNPDQLPDLPKYWVVDKKEGNGLIKGNVNREGKKYYFFPTDKYYPNTKINPEHGEKWFCSPFEANEAGWTRPKTKFKKSQ